MESRGKDTERAESNEQREMITVYGLQLSVHD